MNKIYHSSKAILQKQSMHGFSKKYIKNKVKYMHKITLNID